MKRYRIYANPQGQRDAVKQGWSWPGFFFSIIWALIKKMWGLGIGLFVLFFVLGSLEGAAPKMSAITIILNFLIAIIFGVNGNKWREKKLISRGFDYQDTVNAYNPKAAIALWIKENNSDQTANKATVRNLKKGHIVSSNGVKNGGSVRTQDPSRLQCPKCGGATVRSSTATRRHPWVLIIAVPVMGFGLWFGWNVLTDPFLRQFTHLGPAGIMLLVGLSLLGYALKQEQHFTYTCDDCDHSWWRSANEGPAERDPRRVDWQISRLSYEDQRVLRITVGHEEKVRIQAAKWLGEHRAVPAVEPLITLLDNERSVDHNFREAAADALGRIGDRRAVEPLITLLDNERSVGDHVRKAAADALGRIGDRRAVESLLKAADDDSWKHSLTREAAIVALGEIGDPRARKTLQALQSAKNTALRQMATHALAQLQPEQTNVTASVPRLPKHPQDGKKDKENVGNNQKKVICPNCKVALSINKNKLPEKGAYGNCPKCKSRFFVEKE